MTSALCAPETSVDRLAAAVFPVSHQYSPVILCPLEPSRQEQIILDIYSPPLHAPPPHLIKQKVMIRAKLRSTQLRSMWYVRAWEPPPVSCRPWSSPSVGMLQDDRFSRPFKVNRDWRRLFLVLNRDWRWPFLVLNRDWRWPDLVLWR